MSTNGMNKWKYVFLIAFLLLWAVVSFGIVWWMNQNNYQEWWQQASLVILFWIVYLVIAYIIYRHD